jgi:hypothetical protein
MNVRRNTSAKFRQGILQPLPCGKRGVTHGATATIAGIRCFYGDKNSTVTRAASATVAARSSAEDFEPIE